MSKDHAALIEKIMDFEIGPVNAPLSFAQRLARENNWSEAFAQRAITEYKRFICLIATSDVSHTPSDEVDQVWHLHMTYTQSYWEDLCYGILKRPIHHGPTRGGSQERAKYHSQYERTLSAYRSLFEQDPPQDIWPSARVRFSNPSAFKRINTDKHWVIPKPRMRHFALPALFAGALTTAACTSQNAENPGMGGALIFLSILVGAVIVAAMVVAARAPANKSKTSPKKNNDSSIAATSGSASSKKSDNKGDVDSGDSGCGSGCGAGCGGA